MAVEVFRVSLEIGGAELSLAPGKKTGRLSAFPSRVRRVTPAPSAFIV
jgi:hypothetical protein